MNPNYNQTITVYHKEADGSWGRYVLDGCFFKSVFNVTQKDTQAHVTNTYTARIPMGNACAGAVGDMVVKGASEDEITKEKGHTFAETLAKHKPDAFIVTAFSDNTGHLMDKHYRLGG